MGHLHDDAPLLLGWYSIRVLLFVEIRTVVIILYLSGITKFEYERKSEKDSGRSSEMTPSYK